MRGGGQESSNVISQLPFIKTSLIDCDSLRDNWMCLDKLLQIQM